MPLCYGGGIKNVEQVRKIIKLGAEKVAISSAALENISLLNEMSGAVGAQSVVLVLDIAKRRVFGEGRIMKYLLIMAEEKQERNCMIF